MVDVDVDFSGIKALDRFSATVSAGEWVGVIGPNGSGKTTLMNAITGVYACAGGFIDFRGNRISDGGPLVQGRRGIVRSFQHDQLAATLTLTENIALGLSGQGPHGLRSLFPQALHRRERSDLAAARQVLDEVGCGAFADSLPGEVPQGIRRLADIARALAPDDVGLLLLDEPAAGLSEEERVHLRQVLDHMRESRPMLSVMLIEHDVAFVIDQTERIIALDAGRLIGDGPTAEVLKSEAVMVAFLGKSIDAETE
jgi:branched-chain amino acid transport system ATP-binding protein